MEGTDMAEPVHSNEKTERNRMIFKLVICASVLAAAATLHRLERKTPAWQNAAEAVFAEIGHRMANEIQPGKSTEDEMTEHPVAVAQTVRTVTENEETDHPSVVGNCFEK